MQKTTLAILGALLVSGMSVQAATADEYYYGHRAYFGRDYGPPPSSAPSSLLRRAYKSYNQIGPLDTSPRVPDRSNRTSPGGGDPTLNTSGN